MGSRPNSNRRVVVLGAGGHGAVIVAPARAVGHEVVAVYDDDLSKDGHAVWGVLDRCALEGAMGLNDVRAVIGVGDNADGRASPRESICRAHR